MLKCKSCIFYDSGDVSIGVNEFCDNEFAEELVEDMVKLMNHSDICPYYNKKEGV